MENKLIKLSFGLFLAALIGCQQKEESLVTPELKGGEWRGEMTLQEGVIMPFNSTITKNGGFYLFTLKNGEETIETDDVTVVNDSVFIKTAIFDSEFKLKIVDDSLLTGKWFNYYKADDYAIDVKFVLGKSYRFRPAAKTSLQLAEKYEITFSAETEDEYKAIGLFQQKGDQVSGSFATETGDYRYLEGQIIGESLYLSTFDGAHAFLFVAAFEDSIMDGTFYSGTHFYESFSGTSNPSAALKNPDSLTFIKDGFGDFDFSFENLKGEKVSLNDEQFKNKVVLVQLMGSWCPNCMDESVLFKQFYNEYHSQGLEIIALAFERTKTKEKSLENLKRMQNKLQLPYEILLAGETREDKAEEKLPMLNHVMSYPTAITINKKGEIVSIHTGFYGPGTGEYYEEYVKETRAKLERLLGEY